MKKYLYLWLTSFFIAIVSAQPLTKIAFGSCAHQDKAQEIWYTVGAWKPQLFVFLGDNIYGDSEKMYVLYEKYQKLLDKPGYKKLRKNCAFIGTWDDHDYGRNDAGFEYPLKKRSQEIFLDFFGVPKNSPRRQREGVYSSHFYGPKQMRMQIILLDTRYFRSPLNRVSDPDYKQKRKPKFMGPYAPNLSPDSTMLGKKQWQWLEQQLQQPAKLRIIGTSIPFLADFTGWETWKNMPLERKRLLKLIGTCKAEGVVFISGDTHWAELSKLEHKGLYPIYELTSSGLTETWDGVAPNKNKVDNAYSLPNFGVIFINWKQAQITLQIRNMEQEVKISKTIKLSKLKW